MNRNGLAACILVSLIAVFLLIGCAGSPSAPPPGPPAERGAVYYHMGYGPGMMMGGYGPGMMYYDDDEMPMYYGGPGNMMYYYE